MNQLSCKSQNQFSLRPFREQDRSTILEFWLELDQHVMARLDESLRFAKGINYSNFINKWLSQYQKSSRSLLLVGESQGVIAGFIIAHIQNQEWYKENTVGLIATCYVHSLYRRRGLASLLLEGVQEWFGQENVNYMDVVWDEGNSDAEHFWQSRGFKRSQIRAHRKII